MQLKRMHEPDLLLFVLDLAASEPVIKKKSFQQNAKTQKRSRKACDLEATWLGPYPHSGYEISSELLIANAPFSSK